MFATPCTVGTRTNRRKFRGSSKVRGEIVGLLHDWLLGLKYAQFPTMVSVDCRGDHLELFEVQEVSVLLASLWWLAVRKPVNLSAFPATRRCNFPQKFTPHNPKQI